MEVYFNFRENVENLKCDFIRNENQFDIAKNGNLTFQFEKDV